MIGKSIIKGISPHKAKLFHSTSNNNAMLRSFGRMGTAAGSLYVGGYAIKKAFIFVKDNSNAKLEVTSDKGELSGNLKVSFNETSQAQACNNIPKLEPGKTLPSVLESFDLTSLGNFAIFFVGTFLFLGIVIEGMVIYSFFYRLYSSGLKGTLEWLDLHIEKALKTPVTLLLIVFSIYLLGLVFLAFYSMDILNDSIVLLVEGHVSNRENLVTVEKILSNIISNMKRS